MDLFKFPFLADVWGTASDWVMVIVTVSTVFFIWRTLQSQLTVQRLQQRIFSLSIKPNITIITNPLEIGPRLEDYSFDILVENADAFDLRVLVTHTAEAFSITFLHFFMSPFNIQKGTLHQTSFKYKGSHKMTDPNFDRNLMFMEITFKDELGNSYLQRSRMYYRMALHVEPAILLEEAK